MPTPASKSVRPVPKGVGVEASVLLIRGRSKGLADTSLLASPAAAAASFLASEARCFRFNRSSTSRRTGSLEGARNAIRKPGPSRRADSSRSFKSATSALQTSTRFLFYRELQSKFN